MKCNHTNFKQETHRYQPRTTIASGVRRFQKRPNTANRAGSWVVVVPRMSMEGATCIGTYLVDEQTPYISFGASGVTNACCTVHAWKFCLEIGMGL